MFNDRCVVRVVILGVVVLTGNAAVGGTLGAVKTKENARVCEHFNCVTN